MHKHAVSSQLMSVVANVFCLCYCGQSPSTTLVFHYRAGQRRSIWKSGNIRIRAAAARDKKTPRRGTHAAHPCCWPPPSADFRQPSCQTLHNWNLQGHRQPPEDLEWVSGCQVLYPHLLPLTLGFTNKMCVLLPKTEHKLMSPAGKKNKQMC